MVDSYYSDGSALLADPGNPSVYWTGGQYYSSNYYFSVGKSINSGASWVHQQFGGAGGYLYCMALDPEHPDTVYAGGLESSLPAIYRTLDGGTSWSRLSATGLQGTVNRLAVSHADPNLLIASTTVGIFRSTNFGSSFTRVATSVGNSREILFDPQNADRIWIGTASQGVYQSTDAGATFTAMNPGLSYLAITRLGVDPGNWLFAGTEGTAAYRWSLSTGIGDDPGAPITPAPGLLVVPNPAFEGCTIRYAGSGETEIAVYDLQGRLVTALEPGQQDCGSCECWWDGCTPDGDAVRPGVYLVRVASGPVVQTGRLVIVR